MVDKRIERVPTPEEAARETLEQRARVILIAYKNLDIAETQMPFVSPNQTKHSDERRMVNVSNTPTSSQDHDSIGIAA